MSKDIKDKSLPLDKVIELGKIDRWLRGIADLVPHPSDPGERFSQERDLHAKVPGFDVAALDSNHHVLSFNSRDLIGDKDIEGMRGFGMVMKTAAQRNVRIDVSSVNGDALEISFDPEETFARSRAFGASYANVLPVLFGGPKMGRK